MNPFDFPYLYWSRFYGTVDGKVCSWSFTAEGIKSPLTCEDPYQPRGDTPPVTTYPELPPIGPTHPIIPVDSFPSNVPVTVTPEPSTIMMMAVGVAVIMIGRKFK